jgi:hypothetical protein
VFVLAGALCVFFQRVFAGQYPSSWGEQPLTAVFKGKGSPDDLNNYRPIQNQSAIAKLFHIILLNRLNSFSERCGLRAVGQAGFRAGRRTTDNIFVLRHLADRARLSHSSRDRLFACFVDLEKAYDSVPRDKLFALLASLGLNGPFLTTLCSIYWEVRVRPKCGDGLGTTFTSTCGVRQGDPLSPLLFGLFMDRLEAFLAAHAPTIGVPFCDAGDPSPLRLLLYADDAVLLSTTETGLQTLLSLLSTFCNDNGLAVNTGKTEIVRFHFRPWMVQTRPGPRASRGPGARTPASNRLFYRDTPLTISRSFKYLGVTFNDTLGVGDTHSLLADSARRAAYSMRARCHRLGIYNLFTLSRLFRLLVEPILTYASEVWAPALIRSHTHAFRTHPAEALWKGFLCGLGNMSRRVPSFILSRELCIPPIPRAWIRACAVLWCRLLSPTAPPLMRRAFVADVLLTARPLSLASPCPAGPTRRRRRGAHLVRRVAQRDAVARRG